MAFDSQSRAKIVRDFPVYFDAVSLSGMPAMYTGFLAEQITTIRRLRTVQTRAASASGAIGATLMLGTLASPAKFAVWTTAASAAIGTVTEIKVATTGNSLAIGEVLVLRVQQGKTNGGAVSVQAECVEFR